MVSNGKELAGTARRAAVGASEWRVKKQREKEESNERKRVGEGEGAREKLRKTAAGSIR